MIHQSLLCFHYSQVVLRVLKGLPKQQEKVDCDVDEGEHDTAHANKLVPGLGVLHNSCEANHMVQDKKNAEIVKKFYPPGSL